MSFKSQYATSC